MLSLRSHLAICGVASLILFATASRSFAGGTLFVDDDAPPGGDGITWDTAYRFLQDALTDASGGGISEVRVAQGVYKPDRDEANPAGTGDREATFQLINGVAFMGGYAGLGAKDPDARDIELYETILSGDLLGDDEPDFVNNDENSYHITMGSDADDTALLEGFTITAGNATGEDASAWGGGLFVDSTGSPRVRRCVFISNSSFIGGAIAIVGGELTVLNSDFIANGGSLAAIFTGECANILFSGCNFDGGGLEEHRAMYLSESVSKFINCRFTRSRTSPLHVGGVFNLNGDATFINCEFVDNEGGAGAGLTNLWFGPNEQTNATLINCTFSANTATHETIAGGAIYNGRQGGGDGSAVLVLVNSILWDNHAKAAKDGSQEAQVANNDGTVIVNHACVEGWTGEYGGIGNIDADPMFVSPGNGDYRLSAGSASIDAGHNWGVPVDVNDYDEDGITNELFPVDLEGDPRFNADEADFDPGCGVPVVVDMGAYEYQFDPAENVIFADINGDGSVGAADLLGLLADWGACPKGCCLADLDLDGVVGAADLLILLANWG